MLLWNSSLILGHFRCHSKLCAQVFFPRFVCSIFLACFFFFWFRCSFCYYLIIIFFVLFSPNKQSLELLGECFDVDVICFGMNGSSLESGEWREESQEWRVRRMIHWEPIEDWQTRSPGSALGISYRKCNPDAPTATFVTRPDFLIALRCIDSFNNLIKRKFSSKKMSSRNETPRRNVENRHYEWIYQITWSSSLLVHLVWCFCLVFVFFVPSFCCFAFFEKRKRTNEQKHSYRMRTIKSTWARNWTRPRPTGICWSKTTK